MAGWIENELYKKIQSVMPIPTLDLLILYDKKLLLMKRTNSPAKGIWFTPGGRIFKGESLEDAVTRILWEEIGLEPKSIQQRGVMTHLWDKLHMITIIYRVVPVDDNIRMNYEHNSYRWIDDSEKGLHPYVIKMIDISEIFS